MNPFSKTISEKFTVEQSFVISMLFFYQLWSVIESRVIEEERITGTYSLFFVTVCTGDECCAEWNEAIYRSTKIPKENQKILNLTLDEIFSCSIEFCKHHNERYEDRLSYAVHLLESMKKDPELYEEEWKCWHIAINDTMDNYMDSQGFDWSAKLPIWRKEKTNPISKDE